VPVIELVIDPEFIGFVEEEDDVDEAADDDDDDELIEFALLFAFTDNGSHVSFLKVNPAEHMHCV
jgi:hypothetical protein